MKISVYTIAKNEEKFVERWYNSSKEADYHLIVDTGSTDDTILIAKKLGINVFSVNINPFRFDDARNTSLNLIPTDIDFCIPLDIDEILSDDWRKHFNNIKPNTNRLSYRYVWSWNEDGTPSIEFNNNKIHSRHCYRWKYPVHETLIKYHGEEIEEYIGLEIYHHSDISKNRTQYLPLLEMCVKEEPNDSRCSFYYGRELYYYGMYDKASEELKRYLSLPTSVFKSERSHSMRLLAQCEETNKLEWLTKSINESPNTREPLIDIAKYYYSNNLWVECKTTCDRILMITEKPMDYLCESESWGSLVYDLKAISEYNLGNYKEALEYGQIAYNIDPCERLERNLAYYKYKNVKVYKP
jgi:glycosyltransferase involved in cell wall biosynthesis